ncbi:WD-repeat-containing protein [Coprinopsis cinerea AmutBmut pab1-1]|nr:WD-repeat-containing protein [Coprinopsis cinerea AmutBmut pab1-1]
MSAKASLIFPPNPTTTRGSSTKLSSHKDKVVYTTGKVVVVRDLKNPGLTFAYSGHLHNATVARFSPSGFYCASGDASGTVRVWDVVGEDKALKGEYRVLAGRINDLAWDGESKRIIAVGDGRDKFGHAFMMDTGSSSGEIIGHSKAVNAVSIRPQRPFKAITASDDAQINFHAGVPFKYERTIKTHTKFVQDVKFSPSGDHFLSVGSDAKIFIYEGKAGDTVAEFTDSPHTGTIFAGNWSPDGKSIVTSSGDRTVKLWDVETRKLVSSWSLGTAIEAQQVGNTWNDDINIVSLSMSGALNQFDPRVGDKPVHVYTAPQMPITSLLSTKPDTFFAGTADGRVYSYSTSKQESTPVGGPGHSSYVVDLAASPSSSSGTTTAYSVGFDDHVREIDSVGESYVQAAVKTTAQPKSISISSNDTIFVAQPELIEVFRSNQKLYSLAPKAFKPTAIAARPSGNGNENESVSLVAVGAEDNKVYLFEWDGKELKPKESGGVFDNNKGPISVLAFSPDGKVLAAGDTKGKIMPYSIEEKKPITPTWVFHTARINTLSWTSNSQFLASGSLDTNVYIWSLAKPSKKVVIKEANPGGVNGVQWVNGGEGGKLVSAGADGCARVWDVVFPEA